MGNSVKKKKKKLGKTRWMTSSVPLAARHCCSMNGHARTERARSVLPVFFLPSFRFFCRSRNFRRRPSNRKKRTPVKNWVGPFPHHRYRRSPSSIRFFFVCWNGVKPSNIYKKKLGRTLFFGFRDELLVRTLSAMKYGRRRYEKGRRGTAKK